MNRHLQLLDLLRNVKVYVLGDAMIDRYSFGRIDRLSPEAPVPVFIPEHKEDRRGGSGNVVRQLHALGCTVWESHGALSIKHRYLVGHHPVFRQDKDVISRPTEQEVEWAKRAVMDGEFHAVVISDYAKGWVSESMARAVIDAAQALKIPVIVDPKGSDWTKYAGASIVCPNEREWSQVNEQWPNQVGALVVKRGEKGLQMWSRDRSDFEPHELEFSAMATAKHVYDVTGAGDTVVATIAAVIGAGGTLKQAVIIASHAAGYVVGEIGTSVCPLPVLQQLLGQQEKLGWECIEPGTPGQWEKN